MANSMSREPPDITLLLEALASEKADPRAFEQLFARVHRELRQMAADLMQRERPGHTLQPTALVHEAYIRLVDSSHVKWESRAHFFGIAARAMRQILVDHARARAAEKRGGDWRRITLDEHIEAFASAEIDPFELDDALLRLAELDERMAQIVELRFFGDLTEEEIAHFLGVSRRTVQREWWMARLWLRRELGG